MASILQPGNMQRKEVVPLKNMLSEKGQGLVEYALIFALVILLVIVLVWIFGDQLGEVYSNIIETV